MKPRYFLALAACAALAGCSEKDEEQTAVNQPVSFVLLHGSNGGADQLFEIRQGQRTLFTYQPLHWVGMMKKTDTSALDSLQTTYTVIDEKLKYEDCLLDLKGDGDARYLILDDCEGTAVASHTGWLIDVKDNFSIVGQVPAGENYDYPLPNPELVFTYTDTIARFADGQTADVTVTLKIAKAAVPVLVMPASANAPLRFNPAKYQKMTKSDGITALYCDMMSKGQIGKVGGIAKFIGYTEEELRQFGEPCMEKIRQSKFYPYLVKLNTPNQQ